MGVDYDAILYVGKEFDNQEEAKEFYTKYVDLSQEDLDYIEENDFSEFMYDHKELDGTVTSYYYSNPSFILGVDITYSTGSPTDFSEAFASAVATWSKYFDEPCEVILTVKAS